MTKKAFISSYEFRVVYSTPTRHGVSQVAYIPPPTTSTSTSTSSTTTTIITTVSPSTTTIGPQRPLFIPDGVSAKAVSSDAVEITWRRPLDSDDDSIDGYQIYYNRATDSENTEVRGEFYASIGLTFPENYPLYFNA